MPILQYLELIAPERGPGRILYSHEIPISPDVFNSDFAYTTDFIERVKNAVLSSMVEDISEIERILQISLLVEIDGEKIMHGSRTLDISQINTYPHKKGNSVNVGFASSNIAMDNTEPDNFYPFIGKIILEPEYAEIDRHPMGERLFKFSMKGRYGLRVAPVWYAHNLDTARLPLNLYFRNFAILFNNLGVQQLET